MMRDRIRQWFTATDLPSKEDFAFASEVLDDRLYALFVRQHPRDVLHGVRTAWWLLDRGYDDFDLITAALVHDIAKGAQRRRDRAAFVIATDIGVARWLADPRSQYELRRAVARSLTHSERGAAMLERAGASEEVIALTLQHHSDPGDDPVLALLQQADAAT
jgi:predicted HD phosphohydrolase